jgi:hypothetical protein
VQLNQCYQLVSGGFIALLWQAVASVPWVGGGLSGLWGGSLPGLGVEVSCAGGLVGGWQPGGLWG